MTKPVEKILIDGRQYTRFVRYPKTVRDGTCRCILCGQIDEPEYHTLTCEEAVQRQINAALKSTAAKERGK